MGSVRVGVDDSVRLFVVSAGHSVGFKFSDPALAGDAGAASGALAHFRVLASDLLRLFPGTLPDGSCGPGRYRRAVQRPGGHPTSGRFLAFVFLGPVIEELVFRGYLFQALRHSRLGLWGTLILTSVLFTAIHGYQYPWITLLHVFAFSLLLGMARKKTGSLYVPIALHMLNNAVAMTVLLYFDMY